MQIRLRERVQDIREVWAKETQFSDWLVSEIGIAFLAEELGFEIETLTRESKPGDYPCDIVGNVLGDEHHVVVIENQYGKTDHDHLGKLLTYAAVHKATTGIWISETVSDDHRQVIDWLNDNTPNNVNLYLVAVKLYRIGDSPVAPQLDVVCRPNFTLKETKSALGPAERATHAWRKRMWNAIQDEIRKTKPPFNLQKPSADHWSSISIGRSGFHLSLLLTPRNGSVGIDLYIHVPWKTYAFDALYADRSAIEREIGASLQWMPLDGKKAARVLLEAKIDPRQEVNEPAVNRWFAENAVRMHRAFRPRVLALVPPSGLPEVTATSPEVELYEQDEPA